MEKWIGKIAVVTGASVGIGEQIVKDFAKNGIIVVGLARRPEKIEEFSKELGEVTGKIYAHHCDVSDLQSVKSAFKWIEEKFGFVHILINNAGIGKNKTMLSSDLDDAEDFDEVIKTNFNGLVHVTRYAFALMKKSDDYGIIVNINSIAGHITPFPKDGKSAANVYHGTKHAVTATTEILRQELVCMNNKKVKISVSSISPHLRFIIKFFILSIFSRLAQVSSKPTSSELLNFCLRT